MLTPTSRTGTGGQRACVKGCDRTSLGGSPAIAQPFDKVSQTPILRPSFEEGGGFRRASRFISFAEGAMLDWNNSVVIKGFSLWSNSEGLTPNAPKDLD
jgi:hypothetical protein